MGNGSARFPNPDNKYERFDSAQKAGSQAVDGAAPHNRGCLD